MELAVCASSVDGAITAWDVNTGGHVSSYSPSSTPIDGACCVGGDYLASSQAGRGDSKNGAIYYWAWTKSSPLLKSYPVEAIGPLCCSSDGLFLLGGGASGRVYVWEVSTGRLLRSWPAHYKAVTCLALSDDDSVVISGGEDTMLHVTPLLRVLDGVNQPSSSSPITPSSAGAASDTQQPPGSSSLPSSSSSSHLVRPMFSWQEHAQGVSGLWVGKGGINTTLVSCSPDHTCKIFHLSLGLLLRSVVFPVPLLALCIDPEECSLYAGGMDGQIYITALNMGASPLDGADPTASDDALIGHILPVTRLSFLSDGSTLLSSSQDGTLRVWDTVSKQCLRVMTMPGKAPISSLLVIPRPASMTQQQHLPSSGTSRRPSLAPIQPLQKYPDPSTLGLPGSEPWEEAPVALHSGSAALLDLDDLDASGSPSFGSNGGSLTGGGRSSWMGGEDPLASATAVGGASFSTSLLHRAAREMEDAGSKEALHRTNAQLLSLLKLANDDKERLYSLAVDGIFKSREGSKARTRKGK